MNDLYSFEKIISLKPENTMLDYLQIQGSTENPTLVTVVFTLLLAFLLSSLLAYTFEKTTEELVTSVRFLQSLILVSIVAATVMQAIGDSLARGLGMLGALAIIRFRTTLKTPRNMVFTFASLAAGIACGVYGYVIGIAGTIAFCMISFILKYSPMRIKDKMVGTLKFDLPKSSNELEAIEIILQDFCKKYQKVRYQIGGQKKKVQPSKENQESVEKLVSYEYHICLKEHMDAAAIDTAFANLKGVQFLKINFGVIPENV